MSDSFPELSSPSPGIEEALRQSSDNAKEIVGVLADILQPLSASLTDNANDLQTVGRKIRTRVKSQAKANGKDLTKVTDDLNLVVANSVAEMGTGNSIVKADAQAAQMLAAKPGSDDDPSLLEPGGTGSFIPVVSGPSNQILDGDTSAPVNGDEIPVDETGGGSPLVTAPCWKLWYPSADNPCYRRLSREESNCDTSGDGIEYELQLGYIDTAQERSANILLQHPELELVTYDEENLTQAALFRIRGCVQENPPPPPPPPPAQACALPVTNCPIQVITVPGGNGCPSVTIPISLTCPPAVVQIVPCAPGQTVPVIPNDTDNATDGDGVWIPIEDIDIEAEE